MSREDQLTEALISCNDLLKKAYDDKSISEDRCLDLLTWVYNLKMEISGANERIKELEEAVKVSRVEGVRLGLEAAAKEVTEKVEDRIGVSCPDDIKGCAVFHFRRTERDRSVFEIKHHLKTLDPEAIAKEDKQ